MRRELRHEVGTRVGRQVLDGDVVLTTLTSEEPGPTLALLGGVHGDEDEGVLAVRQVVRRLAESPLSGTVLAVAPANPIAWAHGSRMAPNDGVNLARAFPGDSDGGPTPKVAAGLTESVLNRADVVIDLHSAGLRYEMPLFCGFFDGGPAAAASDRAARAFGVPLIWAHPEMPSGRTLSVAADRGIAAIYVECTGGGGIRKCDLDAYVQGVLNVMSDFGMLPEPLRDVCGVDDTTVVFGSGDLDAGIASEHDGLFVAETSSGEALGAGEQVGAVYGYDGRLVQSVVAHRDGKVMFLRRHARVLTGDVLFVLAELSDSRG